MGLAKPAASTCLANGHGGIILLGVSADGEIQGDPTATAGIFPVQMGDEVVLFKIEGNVATVITDQRVIAFDFTTGLQTVELKYRTPYFYLGMIFSVLTIAVFGFYLRRKN